MSKIILTSESRRGAFNHIFENTKDVFEYLVESRVNLNSALQSYYQKNQDDEFEQCNALFKQNLIKSFKEGLYDIVLKYGYQCSGCTMTMDQLMNLFVKGQCTIRNRPSVSNNYEGTEYLRLIRVDKVDLDLEEIFAPNGPDFRLMFVGSNGEYIKDPLGTPISYEVNLDTGESSYYNGGAIYVREVLKYVQPNIIQFVDVLTGKHKIRIKLPDPINVPPNSGSNVILQAQTIVVEYRSLLNDFVWKDQW